MCEICRYEERNKQIYGGSCDSTTEITEDGVDSSWSCTRKNGHEGVHVACASSDPEQIPNDHIKAVWKDDGGVLWTYDELKSMTLEERYQLVAGAMGESGDLKLEEHTTYKAQCPHCEKYSRIETENTTQVTFNCHTCGRKIDALPINQNNVEPVPRTIGYK